MQADEILGNNFHLVSSHLGPDTLLKANSANPTVTCLSGIDAPFPTEGTEAGKVTRLARVPPILNTKSLTPG